MAQLEDVTWRARDLSLDVLSKAEVKSFIAFIILTVVGLTGCGRKSAETQNRTSDFDHPGASLLEDMAQKNGWQIENVEARDRAFQALESGQQPTDADWQQLVKAADFEKNAFDLSLAMEFSRHMTDKYRAPVVKWCERNMEQTNDPYAAVIAYGCYVRIKGEDRDAWASRLKARGPFYVEKIAEYDRRAADREKRTAAQK